MLELFRQMTKIEIVNEIANNRMIEQIISNISKGNFEDTDDLAQDLYLELLEKDDEKVVAIYNKKQMNFFLTRIVMNNLYSQNSRYYYNYARWRKNRSEFTYNDDIDVNDDEDDYTAEG